MSYLTKEVKEKIWFEISRYIIDKKYVSEVIREHVKNGAYATKDRKKIVKTIQDVACFLHSSKYNSLYSGDTEDLKYIKYVEDLLGGIYKENDGFPINTLYELAQANVI